MGKIKEQVAGKCEVCGADTDLDSPKVCYGCVMAEQGFSVRITYRLRGADDRAAADLDLKGSYEWTVITGLCEAVRGDAMTLAEADACVRDAVEEACRSRIVSTEKVPF